MIYFFAYTTALALGWGIPQFAGFMLYDFFVSSSKKPPIYDHICALFSGAGAICCVSFVYFASNNMNDMSSAFKVALPYIIGASIILFVLISSTIPLYWFMSNTEERTSKIIDDANRLAEKIIREAQKVATDKALLITQKEGKKIKESYERLEEVQIDTCHKKNLFEEERLLFYKEVEDLKNQLHAEYENKKRPWINEIRGLKSAKNKSEKAGKLKTQIIILYNQGNVEAAQQIERKLNKFLLSGTIDNESDDLTA